jgi:hypothetical protein
MSQRTELNHWSRVSVFLHLWVLRGADLSRMILIYREQGLKNLFGMTLILYQQMLLLYFESLSSLKQRKWLRVQIEHNR